MSTELFFGFLGNIITREGDINFDKRVEEVSLGYCPACRRKKPGVYNEIIKEFLCLKCGYPLDDPDAANQIKRKVKHESCLYRTSY